MTSTMYFSFEDSALRFVDTCVGFVACLVSVLVFSVVTAIRFVATALAENWRPLVRLFAIVAAVAVCAMVWQIGIGVAVMAALTWVQKRRGLI